MFVWGGLKSISEEEFQGRELYKLNPNPPNGVGRGLEGDLTGMETASSRWIGGGCRQ